MNFVLTRKCQKIKQIAKNRIILKKKIDIPSELLNECQGTLRKIRRGETN